MYDEIPNSAKIIQYDLLMSRAFRAAKNTEGLSRTLDEFESDFNDPAVAKHFLSDGDFAMYRACRGPAMRARGLDPDD